MQVYLPWVDLTTKDADATNTHGKKEFTVKPKLTADQFNKGFISI